MSAAPDASVAATVDATPEAAALGAGGTATPLEASDSDEASSASYESLWEATRAARPSPAQGPASVRTPSPDLAPIVARELARMDLPELDGRVDFVYRIAADALASTLRASGELPLYSQGRPHPETIAADGGYGHREIEGSAPVVVLETSHHRLEDARGFCGVSASSLPVETAFEAARTRSALLFLPSKDDPLTLERVEVPPWHLWAPQTSLTLAAQALPPASPSGELTTWVERPDGAGLSTPEPLGLEEHPARALGDGEVPRAALDAAMILPIVKGATWTYRSVDTVNGRVESAGTVPARAVEALRIHPEVITVRVLGPQEDRLPSDRLYLGPFGLLSGLAGQSHERLDEERLRSAIERRWSWRESGRTNAPFVVNLAQLDDGAPSKATAERETVLTPAGRFEGCWRAMVLIANIGCQLRWYCPGVGLARAEVHWQSMWGSGLSVLDLVDYEIPPLVPVP